MAITPRVLFRNPLVLLATTGVCLALGFLGSMWMQCPYETVEYEPIPVADACEPTPRGCSSWSERRYVVNALCFQDQGDADRALNAATKGVRKYPYSEPLRNIQGYHLIVRGEYEAAVATLQEALTLGVDPTTGTLENNLAWALLWLDGEARAAGQVPHAPVIEHAQGLYRRSLERDPASCEAMHTGLWVEYAALQRPDLFDHKETLVRFSRLRAGYERCILRDRSVAVALEVVGAAVLDHGISTALGAKAPAPASDDETAEALEHFAAMHQKALSSRSRSLFVRAMQSYTANLPAAGPRGSDVPAHPCSEVPPVANAKAVCNALLVDATQESVSAQRQGRASLVKKGCDLM